MVKIQQKKLKFNINCNYRLESRSWRPHIKETAQEASKTAAWTLSAFRDMNWKVDLGWNGENSTEKAQIQYKLQNHVPTKEAREILYHPGLENTQWPRPNDINMMFKTYPRMGGKAIITTSIDIRTQTSVRTDYDNSFTVRGAQLWNSNTRKSLDSWYSWHLRSGWARFWSDTRILRQFLVIRRSMTIHCWTGVNKDFFSKRRFWPECDLLKPITMYHNVCKEDPWTLHFGRLQPTPNRLGLMYAPLPGQAAGNLDACKSLLEFLSSFCSITSPPPPT